MPYCRLCKKSGKAENSVIQSNSLGDSFVLCLDCPSAGMKSRLSEVRTKTMEAAEAIAGAEDLKADLARGNPNTKLRILVWGPSPSSNHLTSRKRQELKTELIKLGHRAMFSEELTDSAGAPINVQEADQLNIFDIVICIASDLGPTGETHELLQGIGNGVLVWADKKAEEAFFGKGLARTLVANGSKVEYYTDDFVRCCAIVKGSISWVETMVALDNLSAHYMKKAENMRVKRRH